MFQETKGQIRTEMSLSALLYPIDAGRFEACIEDGFNFYCETEEAFERGEVCSVESVWLAVETVRDNISIRGGNSRYSPLLGGQDVPWAPCGEPFRYLRPAEVKIMAERLSQITKSDFEARILAVRARRGRASGAAQSVVRPESGP